MKTRFVSIYHTTKDGKELKSCPRCSQEAGRYVFHPVEEFGERKDKNTVRKQSWCNACRSAHVERVSA